MSNYSKIIDGKRWYWHGWSDIESNALESKARLEDKGKIVKIERGKAGRHRAYQTGKGWFPNSDTMGYHTYYR